MLHSNTLSAGEAQVSELKLANAARKQADEDAAVYQRRGEFVFPQVTRLELLGIAPKPR